jgi:hypothetical protein
MTRATLAEVLQPALRGAMPSRAFVCLGWEDMRAYVAAAEDERAPVILQAGPGCRAHTPLPSLAQMFRIWPTAGSVPVVAHLDHGYGRWTTAARRWMRALPRSCSTGQNCPAGEHRPDGSRRRSGPCGRHRVVRVRSALSAMPGVPRQRGQTPRRPRALPAKPGGRHGHFGRQHPPAARPGAGAGPISACARLRR